MSDQEVIDRLLQGTYKGEKITNVDYDSRTSSICDIWLAGGKRVSFTTGVKALEWVTIEEVIELARSHLTQRALDGVVCTCEKDKLGNVVVRDLDCSVHSPRQ
jgi:hypothetical protein